LRCGRRCHSGRPPRPRPRASSTSSTGRSTADARQDRPQEGRREDAVDRHRRLHEEDQPAAGEDHDRSPAARTCSQRDLDAKRAELETVRADLRSERARLVRLQRRLRQARAVLSTRLVEIFKADKPDILTVVLGSTDFADLLERTEFIRRISDQDRQVILVVRDAKADATSTEARLSKLETRQQQITATVQSRRDQIAAVKNELVGTRVGYAKTRAGKTAASARCATTGTRCRRTSRRWRRRRPRSPRSCASPRATPRPARSSRARASSSGL
jgi:hypothetical protein